MRVLNEKLCADILETGRKEFLALGYRDASLRHIAASLGVTTGAIYRYYADKEALFDALVAQPAQELADRYRAVQQTFAQQSVEEQVRNLPEVPDEEAGWMLDFIYDHFDAFKLIACCAGGTKYEHYLDTLAEIEDNAGRALMKRWQRPATRCLKSTTNSSTSCPAPCSTASLRRCATTCPGRRHFAIWQASGTSILPVGSNCWGSQTPEFPQFFD